jgi:hypothetical protein
LSPVEKALVNKNTKKGHMLIKGMTSEEDDVEQGVGSEHYLSTSRDLPDAKPSYR